MDNKLAIEILTEYVPLAEAAPTDWPQPPLGFSVDVASPELLGTFAERLAAKAKARVTAPVLNVEGWKAAAVNAVAALVESGEYALKDFLGEVPVSVISDVAVRLAPPDDDGEPEPEPEPEQVETKQRRISRADMEEALVALAMDGFTLRHLQDLSGCSRAGALQFVKARMAFNGLVSLGSVDGWTGRGNAPVMYAFSYAVRPTLERAQWSPLDGNPELAALREKPRAEKKPIVSRSVIDGTMNDFIAMKVNFRQPELQEASGAAVLSCRRALLEAVEAGLLERLGPDPLHTGKGKAPILYGSSDFQTLPKGDILRQNN